jgi:hypothetical protein
MDRRFSPTLKGGEKKYGLKRKGGGGNRDVTCKKKRITNFLRNYKDLCSKRLYQLKNI